MRRHSFLCNVTRKSNELSVFCLITMLMLFPLGYFILPVIVASFLPGVAYSVVNMIPEIAGFIFGLFVFFIIFPYLFSQIKNYKGDNK